MVKTRGLALIIVIGILGVLAVLAVAFLTMAQLERRASGQRVNAARAYLLARSGIEDALARLELGQDPAYGGEDWDASGTLNGLEVAAEVYRWGELDTEACPVRHALRPSFFTRDPSSLGADGRPAPRRLRVEDRDRGYSGVLAGDYTAGGNAYALKVQSSNAGIYINGGALDDQDRDPDGPGAKPEDFPLNPGAAAEVAPLLPNKVPDYRDTSMEGPNGFLVRLLNNLDAVVTEEATSNLGMQVVGARPVGGYKSLDELKPVLGQVRYDQFKPYLTLHAWVDPKVVKPQPMDGRPHRWEDIDDAHRTGKEAHEISGVHQDPATVSFGVTPLKGPLLTLNAGILGNGRELDPAAGGLPWTQTITATNQNEGVRTYPVGWERNVAYAWSQLRPAPLTREPRAPLSINRSPTQALAAAFLGLKGAFLEVWDGTAGWDGGFGWYDENVSSTIPAAVTSEGTYPYPSPMTEDTPWHRTRVDYGMTYGSSTGSSPRRPWYGPADYDPHAKPPPAYAGDGKPLVQAAPLGRIKETRPLNRLQALAIAAQILQHRVEAGPFRTWERFNVFVDRLPLWEDANDDGVLDGLPYLVNADGGGTLVHEAHTATIGTFAVYTRRMYRREDRNSDGVMRRQTFAAVSGNWTDGSIGWTDPGLPRAALEAAGQVPGLTACQKDVIRAMANPNTDLNDFNPDANLWKEVDKTDVAGIGSSNRAPPGEGYRPYDPAPDAAAYIHTTEMSLDDDAGYCRLACAGWVAGPNDKLLALRHAGALVKPMEILRHTTQDDFVAARPPSHCFSGSSPNYGLSGGQALVSYPEPLTLEGDFAASDADYDGQIGLGFVAAEPRPEETLRGDLFDTPDATGASPPDHSASDLRGPVHERLLKPAGEDAGNIFPDGVYSEKDRALMFPISGNIPGAGLFHLACWVKPNWFPDASPRPHGLASLSRGFGRNPAGQHAWSVDAKVPLNDIPVCPAGLYFVPARNNAWQDAMETYVHDVTSTRGRGWPCHALLWGTVHRFWLSDDLNRRGVETATPPTRPIGRLEARRWQHVGMIAPVGDGATFSATTKLILGRLPASRDGGGWSQGWGWKNAVVGGFHRDDSENHLRFGEVAGLPNMNYAADATFAGVRAGKGDAEEFLTGASGPAARGRFHKEPRAVYTSAALPPGIRIRRATWTEVPCELWFDENGPGGLPDGWLGDPPTYRSRDDRDGNGKRDAHVELEIWDGSRCLTSFADAAKENALKAQGAALHYRVVFVNEWDPDTRANHPLDVTPFLDDVTITYTGGAGPAILSWETGEPAE